MASVKQKVAAIKKKGEEVAAGAKKVGVGIREQEKVNSAAVKAIESGVQKVEAGIREKTKEIDSGAKQIESGIREQEKVNTAAVKAIESGINTLVNTTKSYVQDFHFGEGKIAK
ncbi:MAG: hypothetical protein ABIH28_03575 [archaeon]